MSLVAEAERRWERANAKPEADPVEACCMWCRFYNRQSHDAQFGTCRRHAPVAVPKGGKSARMFPWLHRNGWCGDFERAGKS